MKVRHRISVFTVVVCATVMAASLAGQRRSELKPSQEGKSNQQGDEGNNEDRFAAGRRLFERETFGGNGRTCLTCHSSKTGTVSPKDAQARFLANPHDP